MKWAWIVFAVLALTLSQTGAAFAQDAIDVFVEREMQRKGLTGVVLAVTRGDTVERVRGYGVDSNGAPYRADSPFYIGSPSKAFTAVAVMQLAEAGKIDLDAPVRAYLPEFRIADPRGDRITVRHLLTHTSGMWEIGFRQWRLPQPDSLEEAVARLRPLRMAADPGMRQKYFNPGYSVAARLVEVVSGQPFDAYMRDNVFLPLGMEATKTVAKVNEKRDGVARGPVHAFGRPIPAPGGPFFVQAAGGVVTTAQDMTRWTIAQATDGAGVLSAAGLAETHRPTPTSRGYALGWNVGESGRISHTGGLPTYSSYVVVESGDAVVVFSPSNDSNSARDIGLGVLAIRQGKPAPAPPPPVLPRLDLVAAVLLALNWAFTVAMIVRTKRWARRPRPMWRLTLSLGPYALVALALLVGLPRLLGAQIPWSWLWIAYYYPVWTVFLWSLTLSSLLVLAVRLFALVRAKQPS